MNKKIYTIYKLEVFQIYFTTHLPYQFPDIQNIRQAYNRIFFGFSKGKTCFDTCYTMDEPRKYAEKKTVI